MVPLDFFLIPQRPARGDINTMLSLEVNCLELCKKLNSARKYNKRPNFVRQSVYS